MMIRNIIILTLNDLAIAFKNKTIYLIFFIPLFVFFSLKLVDRKDAELQKISISDLSKKKYMLLLFCKAIKSADRVFTVSLACE